MKGETPPANGDAMFFEEQAIGIADLATVDAPAVGFGEFHSFAI